MHENAWEGMRMHEKAKECILVGAKQKGHSEVVNFLTSEETTLDSGRSLPHPRESKDDEEEEEK